MLEFTIVIIIIYREKKLSLEKLYFIAENYNDLKSSKKFYRLEYFALKRSQIMYFLLFLIPIIIYCGIWIDESTIDKISDMNITILTYLWWSKFSLAFMLIITGIIFLLMAYKYHRFEFKRHACNIIAFMTVFYVCSPLGLI